MSILSRIETKVYAAGSGAAGGATLGAAADWALGVYHWGASDKASEAANAIAAVPLPISALVGLGITVLGAVFLGYQAPASTNAALAASFDDGGADPS